jgi:aminoglycoside/choline kinase family phosphotransferase
MTDVVLRKFSKYNITKLKEDGSTRSFYRVSMDDENMVLMFCDDRESNQRYLKAYEKYQFLGVPIPKIIDHSLDENYMLFEDLGDRHLRQMLTPENSIEYLTQAIEIILKIQFHKAERVQYDLSFDLEKFNFESNYAFKYYCEEFKGNHKIKKKYGKLFTEINEFLAENSNFLTHRDYHPDNIMAAGGKIALIDYQDTRLGPLPYDLVSLIYDRSNLQIQTTEHLKNYYFTSVQQYHKITMHDFAHLFSVTTIQRMFKILGSFAYLSKAKNNPNYLKFIPRTLEYLDYEIKNSNFNKELGSFVKDIS